MAENQCGGGRILSMESEWCLYDVIEDFSDYDDLLQALGGAQELDTIWLRINCPGGRVDVGQMLVDAIRESKAHVIADVRAPSYSMASFLALQCDDLVLRPGSFLMFHNYSTMAYGKGDAISQMIIHGGRNARFLDEQYKPFLTKTEVGKIQADTDIYIHWDDANLMARIQRHYYKMVGNKRKRV